MALLTVSLGDILAPLGQVAAVIIMLYLFVSILLGLGLTVGLMFGLAWVREKTELIKKVPPLVTGVNNTLVAASHGEPAPPGANTSKPVEVAAQVPMRMHQVEQAVDQGSERVANTVIEIRARTVMAKTILKAFFLPGLNTPRLPAPETETGLEFQSPGYRKLMEKAAPAETPTTGDGYARSVGADTLRTAGAGEVQALPQVIRQQQREANRPDNAAVR